MVAMGTRFYFLFLKNFSVWFRFLALCIFSFTTSVTVFADDKERGKPSQCASEFDVVTSSNIAKFNRIEDEHFATQLIDLSVARTNKLSPDEYHRTHPLTSVEQAQENIENEIIEILNLASPKSGRMIGEALHGFVEQGLYLFKIHQLKFQTVHLGKHQWKILVRAKTQDNTTFTILITSSLDESLAYFNAILPIHSEDAKVKFATFDFDAREFQDIFKTQDQIGMRIADLHDANLTYLWENLRHLELAENQSMSLAEYLHLERLNPVTVVSQLSLLSTRLHDANFARPIKIDPHGLSLGELAGATGLAEFVDILDSINANSELSVLGQNEIWTHVLANMGLLLDFLENHNTPTEIKKTLN